MTSAEKLINIQLEDGTFVKTARMLEDRNAFVINEKYILSYGQAARLLQNKSVLNTSDLLLYSDEKYPVLSNIEALQEWLAVVLKSRTTEEAFSLTDRQVAARKLLVNKLFDNDDDKFCNFFMNL